MSLLFWMVPLAVAMGLVGLAAFLWSMKSGQLEDLDGAAERVLLNGVDEGPLPGTPNVPTEIGKDCNETRFGSKV